MVYTARGEWAYANGPAVRKEGCTPGTRDDNNHGKKPEIFMHEMNSMIRRRRKQGRFGRELVARRDDVMKAGRARRAEAARRARGCKAKLELDTHRIEVEESRTARRRLQALRANDMAAYTQLVEETKNKRLKYLLEQTDSYIRNITDQVGLLRDAEVDAEAPRDSGDVTAAHLRHVHEVNRWKQKKEQV